jgi:hopanoid biosynthesis associated protein HpnK
MKSKNISRTPVERMLVVNADDFGYSNQVNQAVIKAHNDGILTSTSLMVTGDAFHEAVKLARKNPSLGVGLHLVIGKGKAALPHEVIPHLVNRDGEFPDDPLTVGLRYQFNRSARRELFLEIRAQLQRFRETGLAMSHVDGHLHNHMHPYVLQCLVSLSQEFGIHFIRLPNEELTLHWQTGSRTGPGTILIWMVFKLLRVYAKKLLSNNKIGYCDRVYGLLQTGKMSKAYLCKLLPKIRGEKVEIYAHPSLPIDKDLQTKLEMDGLLEFKALTNKAVKKIMKKSNFTAVTFAEL